METNVNKLLSNIKIIDPTSSSNGRRKTVLGKSYIVIKFNLLPLDLTQLVATFCISGGTTCWMLNVTSEKKLLIFSSGPNLNYEIL